MNITRTSSHNSMSPLLIFSESALLQKLGSWLHLALSSTCICVCVINCAYISSSSGTCRDVVAVVAFVATFVSERELAYTHDEKYVKPGRLRGLV